MYIIQWNADYIRKIDSYIRTFKTDLCEQIQGNPLFDEHKEEQMKMINFIYEYDNFELNKEDFMKRKRIKSTIPVYERCYAKRASGEQSCRKEKGTNVSFVELIVRGHHMVLLLILIQ